jgi:hypothetical protein
MGRHSSRFLVFGGEAPRHERDRRARERLHTATPTDGLICEPFGDQATDCLDQFDVVADENRNAFRRRPPFFDR